MNYDLKQPKAMVVDDDPAIVKVISKFLERKGYRCSVTEDGKSALDLIDRHFFDLVVTDMYMPDVTGVELLQEIVLRSPHTATVMLTGSEDDRVRYDARDAGVDVFLNKSADPDEIAREIAQALMNKTIRLAAGEMEKR